MGDEDNESTTNATVLICGVVHFAWRHDWRTFDVGDLHAPQRVQEIEAIVQRLARFRPTHVAVEVEQSQNEPLNARYHQYVAENTPLDDTEVEQLGFRVARASNHARIYGIDWMGSIPGQRAYGDVMAWAQQHQRTLYETLTNGKPPHTVSSQDRTLIELLRDANCPKEDDRTQQRYLLLAQVGAHTDYVGVDWLMWWYRRNLILYSNIARLAATPGSRILVLIGAGHRFLLHQFLRDSGRCAIDDVRPYLA